MLQAVETIGRLPGYYFQGVGSGAGAIAVHQAAKRLVADSRFGSVLPRLMLAQNAPFAPIYDSWIAGGRELVEIDPAAARTLAQGIVAKVLSNRLPPYSAAGGLFDVLCESQGDAFAVHNEEVMQAVALFEKCEGIDIDPAAGVALAALTNAARSGQIRSHATVLLHITGGGVRKRASENTLFQAPADLEIPLRELGASAAAEKARGLFANQTLQA
jgi:cysteate synthase